MEKISSKLKRKHTNSKAAEDYLHPGEWRDGKRSRSPSRSRSPIASEATPGTSGSNDNTQSYQVPQEPSSSSSTHQEHNAPRAVGPVPSIMLPIHRNTTATTTTVWTGLEQALQALRLTAKACTPLRLAVDDLVSCLSLFEAAAKNRKDYEDLATGLKSMVGILIQHLEDAASENISNTLVGIAGAIRREIESIGNRQSREGLRRVLGSTGDEEDLIRRYRRIEQLFRQLQGEASLSAWNISSKVHINMQLESLRAAKLARYDSELATEVSRRACTENTRIKVLEDLIEWSEDRTMASIYWMNGMAGTGKTTIAYSACAALESSKQLAASFFCTRMSPDCRDAKRIVPTIAYQLARRSTPFRSALCKALEEDPDISTGIISVQFDRLLRKPLIEAKINMPNNLVVVVDALDECSDPYVVELFLDILFRSVVDLPLKFFVTSRPEPIIRRRMMLEGNRLRTILYLHEIEQSLVQAEVELYLKEELKFIAPADDTIKQLAAYAGNLFIYAATAVRYIRPDRRLVDSRKRLETILAIDTKAKKGLSALDTLYCTILTMAIEDPAVEDEERRNMQLIIWTSVCAIEPVLIKTLAAISGVNSKDATMAALEPLRSVLHISDHNDLVATLHASFPDYILNHERSGQFSCDVPRHNQLISERCFEIMRTQLRFNICNIKSSFIPDAEIPDLKEQVIANISEELFYSCRFWMDHLEPVLVSGTRNSTETYPPLSPFLNIFLSKHLLFWMEVLNLKSSLFIGVTSISRLSVWLGRLVNNSSLFELASSAQSFVISYASWPISNYTAHIYLSALPFAISMSRYLPKFTGLVKVSGTTLGRIGQAALSSWQYESTVFSTAFSPTVDRILLGKENGELIIQKVHDGKYLFQPFKAHDGPIVAMSVSCDGAQVVTGSYDTTLSIWSVHDGSLVSGPFRAHTDSVVSVSFSPDATNIASGSDDCTVGIWVSRDASAPVKRFTGHKEGVNSVAFSADGTRVISGSSDGTIRIWDIFNETSIHSLGERGGGPITAVHFMPDEAKIISFSPDEISVWDASNGSYVRRRRNHSSAVSLIAFSPRGDRMVGVEYNSIYVWDMSDGLIIAGPFSHKKPFSHTDTFSHILEPFSHTKQITSVGFSADGTRIISACNDLTVCVWSVHKRMGLDVGFPTTPIPQASLHAQIFVIAPDHTSIATSNSTDIYLWNLDSHDEIYIPTDPSDPVICLQFSNDAAHIFSVHTSGIVNTWNIYTTKLVEAPRRCSTIHAIRSAVCSPDGRRVAIYSLGKFEIWDVGSNRRIASHTLSKSITYTASNVVLYFSSTGARLLVNVNLPGDCGGVTVWDTDNGAYVSSFNPNTGIRALDISSDGTYVAYCSTTEWPWGSEIFLINMSTKEINSIPPKDQRRTVSTVISAKFSDDGLYMACIVGDWFYIWDIRHRVTISALNNGFTIPNSLASTMHTSTYISFAPDGWCLVYSACRPCIHSSDSIYFRAWRFRLQKPILTIGSDGWALDGPSRPLFWVPAEVRLNFPNGNGFVLEDKDTLLVDYNGMLVGEDWSKCYIGG